MMNHVTVIGSGFAGLSAATFLAKEGFDVSIYEKNESPGGRARKFEHNGFVFDMGPSWYWMPDVFEKYFNLFGKTTSDYYQLKRLDPSYRVYFGKDDYTDIPAGIEALCTLFESLEKGSSNHLLKFLDEGKYKYDVGINNLVYKPGLSLSELVDFTLIKGMLKLHVFQSMSCYVRKFFKDDRIIKLLEFPVLFLGAAPQKTPALYSLMNYADMALGTWYPMGGMYKIIEGMVTLAQELRVKFHFNSSVTGIDISSGRAKGLNIANQYVETDYIIAGADYHHVEQQLLPKTFRKYADDYWQKRVLAPSSLIFYLGINKKVKNLLHHNLFFDEDFERHASEIYEKPQWPTAPQFYVSCPSKTDLTVAPDGCENLFILIPVAPDLQDREEIREQYFDIVINRLERLTGESIKAHIIYKRTYAHNDFISDYNAFKGNAYGLANTLLQTANLKPSIFNKNVGNLFYTGQLTVPGPGVPPSLISGQVAAKALIDKHRKKAKHERPV
ncbi:phytoene desaturase family protein [Chryseosolibacter indicus]|uniref:Phytoene desaturase n=1 Tax=Chryseosolibacter indicus TaxID=2782351 RepID=A0ABS5VY51_9BACT|nr:phytoene desaturase family protein [Chryseosolibacter indicus]MBT1705679.1 phytoene desaturase [Chryseosolibacter indicus]